LRPSAQTTATKQGTRLFDTELEQSDDHLVDQARHGDSDALDTLLKRYTSYARSKARTYFLIGADREDIVQEGMIGLFKAIRDFDAEKTVSFRSFAELCITRQIITAIKTATRQKHTPLNSYVSLHRPVMSDEDGERQLADFLASAQIVDPVELVVAEDEVSQIRAFLAGILSDLEAEVLNMYLQGKSYQDIALKLDRQAKSIDNALQRIKRKLETFLEQREQHAQETAAASERVVHVSRFTTPSPEPGVLRDDLTLEVSRRLRLNGKTKANGSNGGTNGNSSSSIRPNGQANGNGRKTKAAKALRAAPKLTAAKPKGRARASARTGDLRASLRFAVAAAARTGAKAGRTVRKAKPAARASR
jgi:RNA polymerase sporulation-specific sigma factor